MLSESESDHSPSFITPIAKEKQKQKTASSAKKTASKGKQKEIKSTQFVAPYQVFGLECPFNALSFLAFRAKRAEATLSRL